MEKEGNLGRWYNQSSYSCITLRENVKHSGSVGSLPFVEFQAESRGEAVVVVLYIEMRYKKNQEYRKQWSLRRENDEKRDTLNTTSIGFRRMIKIPDIHVYLYKYGSLDKLALNSEGN